MWDIGSCRAIDSVLQIHADNFITNYWFSSVLWRKGSAMLQIHILESVHKHIDRTLIKFCPCKTKIAWSYNFASPHEVYVIYERTPSWIKLMDFYFWGTHWVYHFNNTNTANSSVVFCSYTIHLKMYSK